MAIQPNIALMYHPDVPVEDVLSQAKKVQGLRSMMTEDNLRQQQILQSQQQVLESKAQMDNYQAQAGLREQEARDQQAWSRTVRKANGNFKDAFDMAARDPEGPSSGYVAAQRKAYDEHVKAQSEIDTGTRTANKAALDRIGMGVSGIAALPPERQQQAWDSWFRGASSDPVTKDAIAAAVKNGAIGPLFNAGQMADFNMVTNGAKSVYDSVEALNKSKKAASEVEEQKGKAAQFRRGDDFARLAGAALSGGRDGLVAVFDSLPEDSPVRQLFHPDYLDPDSFEPNDVAATLTLAGLPIEKQQQARQAFQTLEAAGSAAKLAQRATDPKLPKSERDAARGALKLLTDSDIAKTVAHAQASENAKYQGLFENTPDAKDVTVPTPTAAAAREFYVAPGTGKKQGWYAVQPDGSAKWVREN